MMKNMKKSTLRFHVSSLRMTIGCDSMTVCPTAGWLGATLATAGAAVVAATVAVAVAPTAAAPTVAG